MSPAPDERDRIRAAMDRILQGTAQRSNGALNIVALAQEAGVPRNALTQRHVDLNNDFYAQVKARGQAPDSETRLRLGRQTQGTACQGRHRARSTAHGRRAPRPRRQPADRAQPAAAPRSGTARAIGPGAADPAAPGSLGTQHDARSPTSPHFSSLSVFMVRRDSKPRTAGWPVSLSMTKAQIGDRSWTRSVIAWASSTVVPLPWRSGVSGASAGPRASTSSIAPRR